MRFLNNRWTVVTFSEILTSLVLMPHKPCPTIVKGVDGASVVLPLLGNIVKLLVSYLFLLMKAEREVESCKVLLVIMLADDFKRKNSDGDRVEIEELNAMLYIHK